VEEEGQGGTWLTEGHLENSHWNGGGLVGTFPELVWAGPGLSKTNLLDLQSWFL